MKKAFTRGSLTSKATAAMQDAIDKLIAEHRREGRPLAVWQDGKAALVSAGRPAVVRERPATYQTHGHGKKR